MTAAAGHTPLRTCLGCRRQEPKSSLLRLVRGEDGTVQPDPQALRTGRGAYLHRRPECVEQARRRHALERALRARATDSLWAALVD